MRNVGIYAWFGGDEDGVVSAEDTGEELRDGADVIDVVLVVEECRRR